MRSSTHACSAALPLKQRIAIMRTASPHGRTHAARTPRTAVARTQTARGDDESLSTRVHDLIATLTLVLPLVNL
jgi:hypothetical protein